MHRFWDGKTGGLGGCRTDWVDGAFWVNLPWMNTPQAIALYACRLFMGKRAGNGYALDTQISFSAACSISPWAWLSTFLHSRSVEKLSVS